MHFFLIFGCVKNTISWGPVFFYFKKPKQVAWFFKESSLIGKFFHRVAMSIFLSFYLSPLCEIFFEASHWPSDHMIRFRPLIGWPPPLILIQILLKHYRLFKLGENNFFFFKYLWFFFFFTKYNCLKILVWQHSTCLIV